MPSTRRGKKSVETDTERHDRFVRRSNRHRQSSAEPADDDDRRNTRRRPHSEDAGDHENQPNDERSPTAAKQLAYRHHMDEMEDDDEYVDVPDLLPTSDDSDDDDGTGQRDREEEYERQEGEGRSRNRRHTRFNDEVVPPLVDSRDSSTNGDVYQYRDMSFGDDVNSSRKSRNSSKKSVKSTVRAVNEVGYDTAYETANERGRMGSGVTKTTTKHRHTVKRTDPVKAASRSEGRRAAAGDGIRRSRPKTKKDDFRKDDSTDSEDEFHDARPEKGSRPTRNEKPPLQAMSIPDCDGSEWVAYHGKFEKICKFNQYSENEKAIKLSCALVGPAAKVLLTTGSQDWTYRELVEELASRFGQTESRCGVHNELFTYVKETGQTSRQFADILVASAGQAQLKEEFANAAVYHAFLFGLRAWPQLQNYVHLHDHDYTLPSALKWASQYERDYSSGRGSTNVSSWTHVHRRDVQSNTEIENQMINMREVKKLVPTVAQLDTNLDVTVDCPTATGIERELQELKNEKKEMKRKLELLMEKMEQLQIMEQIHSANRASTPGGPLPNGAPYHNTDQGPKPQQDWRQNQPNNNYRGRGRGNQNNYSRDSNRNNYRRDTTPNRYNNNNNGGRRDN